MTTDDLLILKPLSAYGHGIMFRLVTDNGDTVVVSHIVYSKLDRVTDDLAKLVSNETYGLITKAIKSDNGKAWLYDVAGRYVLPKELLVVQAENFFK